MKILLAVDGSTCTKQMLAYLAAHDEFLGAGHDYTVLTVTMPVPAHAKGFFDRETVANYYRAEADDVLKPVRAFVAQQKWNASFVEKVGHAPTVISELADSGHFDLVVMGSHGHSSIGSVVLGSVTTRVLNHCKTPVLVIR
jgi:nucleotide-binding universal stress UspA family protein